MSSSVTSSAVSVAALQSSTFESSLKGFEVSSKHTLIGHCTLTVAERPREVDEKGSTKRAAGSKRQGGSKRALIGGSLHATGVQAPFYFYFKLIGKKTFSNAGHVKKYTRCNYVKHVQRFHDFSLITIFTSPGVEKNSREIGVRIDGVKESDKQSHPPLVLSTGHDVARVQLQFYMERHEHSAQHVVSNNPMVEFHSIYSEMAEILFGIDAPSTQVRNSLTVRSTQSIREDWIRTVEDALSIGSAPAKLATVPEEDEKHSDQQYDEQQYDTSLSASSSAASSSFESMSTVSSPNTEHYYRTTSSSGVVSPSLPSLIDAMTGASCYDDHDSPQGGSTLYSSEGTQVAQDNFGIFTLPDSQESYDQLPLSEVRTKLSPFNHEIAAEQIQRKRKVSEEDEKEFPAEDYDGYFQSKNKRYKSSSDSPISPSPLAITPFGSVTGVFQHAHSVNALSPSRDYVEEDNASDVDANEELSGGINLVHSSEGNMQPHGSPAHRSPWFNTPSLSITVPGFSRSHSRSSAYDESQPQYSMSPFVLDAAADS